jgi:hypothetical protein
MVVFTMVQENCQEKKENCDNCDGEKKENSNNRQINRQMGGETEK